MKLFFLFYFIFFGSLLAKLPLPEGLKNTKNVREVLASFDNLPYRPDGAIDEEGRYTLFSKQNEFFDTPGLNCSGFVLEVMRILLNKNIPLKVAAIDRLSNSGKYSIDGEDWDFGWDLIMNITEGTSRRLLLPNYNIANPLDETPKSQTGFEVHRNETWQELPDRLKKKHIYLVAFNADKHLKGYKLIYYHLGLIYVAEEGILFYHTTGQFGGVNYYNLSLPQELEKFKKTFYSNEKNKKRMLILELRINNS